MAVMTRRALLEDAVQRLEQAGVEDARRNAEWMLEDAAGVTRPVLLTHPEEVVTAEEREAF
ncbi:MAG: hypothetical protein R3362_08825 [Rhodothermales bacterium]|nr:hypothetical protein [Rhodothermales bacterium]